MGIAEIAIVGIVLMFISSRGRSRRSSFDDGGGLRDTVRELQSQIEAAHAELDSHRQQISELAERVDFTERRLVQARDGRTSLPAPPSEPTTPPGHT